MAIQNAQSRIIRIPRHQSHEKAVVSHIVSSHYHEIEQVPNRAFVDILYHKLPNQIVGMVGVAIEEGGQKAEEFALLDDLGLFGKYWRPEGREGDTLKLDKPVEVVSTKGS